MGLRKKNQAALKRLRKRGFPIDENFRVPETFFMSRKIDPMDPETWAHLGIGDFTRYVRHDPFTRHFVLDPMLVRLA